MTQAAALRILQTGANVFLTGEPGAGKTHTVNAYIRWLRCHGVEPSITASTGIAAVHVGGMTIHSWSGIGIKKSLDAYELDRIGSSEHIVKRLRRAKVLIIDEISMLAPDTLDMVEAVCREVLQSSQPFGGLQVVLVGDFFQLPPVVARAANTAEPADSIDELFEETRRGPFAYHASAWERLHPLTCYLTEQHRQDDDAYLRILSAIRSNAFTEEHLEHIEKRKIEAHAGPKNAPRLFSHNADVDTLNDRMLRTIAGKTRTFSMTASGMPALAAALKKSCLSPEELHLKEGAAVMFTKNNPKEGYVNGTLGTVTGWSEFSGNPLVKTREGLVVEAEPGEWSVEENGVVRARITQVPLRLAWAITVHKSQGMSMDEAVMDLSQVFEYGQGYVALSRVRRLSGLHLLGWNNRAFLVHPDILAKDGDFRLASDTTDAAFEELPARDIAVMHERFLRACGGTIAAASAKNGKALPPAKKQPTIEITFALFKSGNTITEIAKERGITVGTVAGHIGELFAKRRISSEELTAVLSPALKKALPIIHAAFKESGVSPLAPIFQKLRGTYSYDDLRLARMLYDEARV